jgi:WD40 repeat protein
VRVWDVESETERKALAGHTGAVYSVDVSPDGQLLISAGADKNALVWDTSTWQRIAELRGSNDEVQSAAFSPDQQHLVAASAVGFVRIYPRETFAPLDEVLRLVPWAHHARPAWLDRR